MAIKVWDKESSLGGWSRIIATIGQLSMAVAIGMGSPESTPDLSDVAGQGAGIISSGYALYAQIILFAGSCLTAWSKFRAVKNK